MDDPKPKTNVTQLLRGGGDEGALFNLVYGELRALAQIRMSQERAGHTLQATALVNEVYLRLIRDEQMEWRDRRHFYGAAVEAMRRVLVDHARKVRSKKRGGEAVRLDLTLSGFAHAEDPDHVLALEEGLEKLAEEDPRCAEGARLRIYAGFSSEDVAHALELTPRTVQRDWAYARARLVEILGTPQQE